MSRRRGRAGGTRQKKSPWFAASINCSSNCVPNSRNALPLVDQHRRIAYEHLSRVSLSHCALSRVIEIVCRARPTFSSDGLSDAAWTFHGNSRKLLHQLVKFVIYNSPSITFFHSIYTLPFRQPVRYHFASLYATISPDFTLSISPQCSCLSTTLPTPCALEALGQFDIEVLSKDS